jgi:hypothetical protein
VKPAESARHAAITATEIPVFLNRVIGYPCPVRSLRER